MSAKSRGPIPAKTLKALDKRDGQHDRLLGHYIGTGRNAHHRQLRARGGENDLSNLVTMSGSGTFGTHGWAHANVGAATRLGFIVASWHDPAIVPIYLADVHGRKAWHRLNDDGDAELIGLEHAESIMFALGIWAVAQ